MSTTSQLTTFSDLFTDLQNRVRLQTGITASQNQAKRYVNIGLHDMHISFAYLLPWAERSDDLVTQAEYTTGTITATLGSTAITGASTAWNTNNDFSVANMRAGGKIVIDGGKEVYEISSVTNDTAAVLTSAFIKPTVTAGTYVYFEDEYALHADFLRPMDIQSFDTNGDIELIGRNEFRLRYPRNKTTGKPQIATIVDKPFSGDTTPVRKVRFWKPPNAVFMIPYTFITSKLAISSTGVAQDNMSADTDEPIVPLRYRHAIVYHALYHWFAWKQKDLQAANMAKAEYTDIMLRITGDQEIGRSRPQFRPRMMTSSARSPFRAGRAGRYTTGSRFDEIR